MKKIFALVMIVSILSAFMAGCSKSDDSAGGTPKDAPKAGADAGK